VAVRIFVKMRALPGKGAEVIKARLPRHAEVRQDAGCEQFDLFQNTEDPDDFLLAERWSNQELLDAHYAIDRPRMGGGLMAPSPGPTERYIVD